MYYSSRKKPLESDMQKSKGNKSLGKPAADLQTIYVKLTETYQNENALNQKWTRANCKLEKTRNQYLFEMIQIINSKCSKTKTGEIEETLDNVEILKKEIIHFLDLNTVLTQQYFNHISNQLGMGHRQCIELAPQALLEFLWMKASQTSDKPLKFNDLMTGVSLDTRNIIKNDPLFIYIATPTFSVLREKISDLMNRLRFDLENNRNSYLKDNEFLTFAANFIEKFEQGKKVDYQQLEEIGQAINPKLGRGNCVYPITAELLNNVLSKIASYQEKKRVIDELQERYSASLRNKP